MDGCPCGAKPNEPHAIGCTERVHLTIAESVPDHQHPLSDVTQLVEWQASVERQLTAQDRALRNLVQGFLAFFVFVVIFAIAVVVVVG